MLTVTCMENHEGWHENGYKKFEANYSDGQLERHRRISVD